MIDMFSFCILISYFHINNVLPNKSMAYTGLFDARASKLRHHKPTPAPSPCSNKSGVFCESEFNDMVHILSDEPTIGPISTYHPR